MSTNQSETILFSNQSETILFSYQPETILLSYQSKIILFSYQSETILFSYQSETILFRYHSETILFSYQSETILFSYQSETSLYSTLTSSVTSCSSYILHIIIGGGGHGRGRMVVGFTTTYAISAHHHWCLMLWVRILIRARCTTLCDNVCQWLATGRWFSPCLPVSYTNKSDRHDISESGVASKQASKHHYFRHFTTQRIQRPIKMAVLNFSQKDSTLWYICLALYREKTVCVNIYTYSWNKYNEQKYYQNAGVVDEQHIYRICIRWYLNTY